jgi:hypothetical protein
VDSCKNDLLDGYSGHYFYRLSEIANSIGRERVNRKALDGVQMPSLLWQIWHNVARPSFVMSLGTLTRQTRHGTKGRHIIEFALDNAS